MGRDASRNKVRLSVKIMYNSDMKSLAVLIKKDLERLSKPTLVIRIGLGGIVLAVLTNQIVLVNWPNIALCLVTLVLMVLPDVLSLKLKLTIPGLLEIAYGLFLFASLVLGEVFAFYGIFPLWDVVLHLLSGFVCAGIGLALVGFMNGAKLSAGFTVLVAFCFSMTAGVMWEFCEFAADITMRTDAQKDAVVGEISTMTMHANGSNQPKRIDEIEHTEMFLQNGEVIVVENGYLDIGLMDTMKDLFVNLIGAAAFCVLGFFYVKNDGKIKLVDKVIPKKE